jgi:dTDP-4-dehydrorhamnose reductase
MKKILVLGATGMIGSTLFKYLSLDKRFLVCGTYYSSKPMLFFGSNSSHFMFTRFDATNAESLLNVINNIEPNIVINCIGVVKQGLRPSDIVRSIELNALFPHRLNELCFQRDIRLIHISTDCVFNGSRGNYGELDATDALDVYGQTKALGEKLDGNSCVIRTSCVGREFRNPKKGLLEWFLAQNGEILGYSKAIFSGVTSLELAKVVSKYFLGEANRPGLWNISTHPINKFELLNIFKSAFHKDIQISVDGTFKVDRSLDSSKFHEICGHKFPDWMMMLKEAQLFDAVDIA